MSFRQNIKVQPQRKQSDRQIKYLTVHSRSKQKSSSGEDKKNEGLLRKIFYKHEIFDKQISLIKFKPLNQIKEEQSPSLIKKYKSNEHLSWKDKVISIMERQQEYRNEHGKSSQREKLRSNSSKSGSRDNSQKNIQILQIENHQIVDQRKSIDYKRQQKNSKEFKSSEQLKKRQSLQQIPQQQQVQPQRQNLFKPSSDNMIQIVKVQKHALDRDQEIIAHKYQSNLKFLIAQTSELLSYNKHIVLEEQLTESKRQMSELNIQIRKMRIEMRNHGYTKEINFTFPVQKHNDHIMVKMPDQVPQKQIDKYYLMLEKLQIQKLLFTQQQNKIHQLQAYHQTLLNKYEPILSSAKIDNQNLKLSSSKTNLYANLAKSKSSQRISIKSREQSSLASSNSQSPTKKVISQVKILTPVKGSESQLNYTRYQTLVQKKQALKESIKDTKVNIDVKIVRLIKQINLLKKQIDLIDSNIKTTDEHKTIMNQQIENAKNRNEQKQSNIERQYQVIANERRANNEKQKQRQNIQRKGFTLFLRSHKSLSPVNYVSSPSNKISNKNCPRNIKRPQLNKVNEQWLSRQKNLENLQSAKFIKTLT